MKCPAFQQQKMGIHCSKEWYTVHCQYHDLDKPNRYLEAVGAPRKSAEMKGIKQEPILMTVKLLQSIRCSLSLRQMLT
jgi:hypothetical protein